MAAAGTPDGPELLPDPAGVAGVAGVPGYASAVFGSQLLAATRYAELLCTAGIDRGLLGPREAARVWERHLVNCALIAELIPTSARVVDVGSGAGLPGLVLALRRPDLRIDLVESLRRRVDFLTEAVGSLDLADRVRVVHGRAEDANVIATVGGGEWVTARALAPLDRLVRWCLPLLRPGGSVLAMKGDRAATEVAEYTHAVAKAGGSTPRTVHCAPSPAALAAGLPPEAGVTVVVVQRMDRGVRDGRGRA